MTFSALLLAGGESRRMGRDKATIGFRGRPLWERQLELLRGLGPEKIFVSARTAPAWLPQDAELLLDDPPSRGPLSGISKALTAIKTTHLIVLAVDMPFMATEEFGRLLELTTQGRGVVPMIGDRAEPLAAIYPAETANHFRVALAGDDFSLQTVIRSLAVAGKMTPCAVSQASARLYRNVNTPAEFDA